MAEQDRKGISGGEEEGGGAHTHIHTYTHTHTHTHTGEHVVPGLDGTFIVDGSGICFYCISFFFFVLFLWRRLFVDGSGI
jgi:hypothetical protein